MSFPRDLGKVSAEYESGGRGVDFVSNGSSWGDPGKNSYGIHQLSGAYSMGAFLRSKWGAPYRAKFGSMKPATPSFDRKYVEVARADPEGFAYAQKAYYATTHYLPLRDHARKKGFDTNDRGVQEALFSMSVQHGRAKYVVSEAAEGGVPNDPRDQIKKLFKERSEYVLGLRSLSKNIKNNIVYTRYKNELQDCLELAGETDVGELEVKLPSITLDQDVGDSLTNVGGGLIKIITTVFNTLFKLFSKMGERASERFGELEVKLPETDFDFPKLEKDVEEKKELPWMVTAKKLVGLREVAGKRSNSTIINWARQLGGTVKNIYTNDGIAWCGLFTAHVMNDNDIRIGFNNPLGARNWGKFGVATTPRYGAIMTFWRGSKSGWKGHVGIYVSEDSKYYHILGGNQSNSVNVTKIAKSRFLKARWPKEHADIVDNFGPIKKKFDGKVSTNEA